MAMKAYVFIETGVGKTKDLLASLRRIKEVTEADAVTGEYDIVAVVIAEGLEGIGEVVTNNIHAMGGIVRTKTYVATGWHN